MSKNKICKECANEYDSSLSCCPHCGYTSTNTKINIFLVSVCLALISVSVTFGFILYNKKMHIEQQNKAAVENQNLKLAQIEKMEANDKKHFESILNENSIALKEVDDFCDAKERETAERNAKEYQNNITQDRNGEMVDKLLPNHSSQNSIPRWLEGHWRHVDVDAGYSVNIYIHNSNIKFYITEMYQNPRLDYNGVFNYTNGSQWDDGWDRITFPGTFILVDPSIPGLIWDDKRTKYEKVN